MRTRGFVKPAGLPSTGAAFTVTAIQARRCEFRLGVALGVEAAK
jgi:hypothetical protein